MQSLIFDLETDGLLDTVTKIQCINLFDRELGVYERYHDDVSVTPRAGSLLDGLYRLAMADTLYGHNITRYDLPVIRKLHPLLVFNRAQKVIDTLASARVIWTDMADRDFAALRKGKLPEAFQKARLVGSHALQAWGWRLGDYKGDFDPKNYMQDDGEPHTWATIPFSQDMSDYCEQDVLVTLRLLTLIESKNYSPECLDLEQNVARIIARQEQRGFAFDEEGARGLYAKLQRRRLELEASLQETFKPWQAVAKVFTPKVNNAARGYVKGVEVTTYKTVTFNPGSRDHIADRLAALRGWQPEEFTDNGKPKVDETVLEALPFPEAKLIAEYLMVVKRLGQIGDGTEAWLKAVRNGRIYGAVNSNGAVTGRMTHMKPNLGQVPRCGSPYGEDCRALFVVPEGKMLVGCDAEGLELRMLAHYMARWDDGAYVEVVVNGKKENGTDVHTVNQNAIGLNERDSAKTFIYAMIYGAGDFKLGTIVYLDFDDEKKARFDTAFATKGKRQRAMVALGKSRRANLMSNLPALGKFVDAVKKAAKRGYLIGLDGRLLHVRSEHAAPNTLLQSGGAVVMKKALVLLDEERTRRSLAFEFVANIHDEFQMETEEDNLGHPHMVGQLAADAIRRAGEHFNLRCPLAGSFNVGANWAETH